MAKSKVKKVDDREIDHWITTKNKKHLPVDKDGKIIIKSEESKKKSTTKKTYGSALERFVAANNAAYQDKIKAATRGKTKQKLDVSKVKSNKGYYSVTTENGEKLKLYPEIVSTGDEGRYNESNEYGVWQFDTDGIYKEKSGQRYLITEHYTTHGRENFTYKVYRLNDKTGSKSST